MGQIKISELTPKEEPLSTTDLLIIAQETPDGFESRSITGRDIINAIPAPETNPKMIASVVGSGVMGTTNQISASVLIPSGTIATNQTIHIKSFIDRTVVSGAGATTLRFYVNTANTLTGATYLGSGGGMATSVRFQRFERNIFFDGTNLNLFFLGISAPTDYTTSAITLISFNPEVDNYLIFAVQHSTSLTDVATWKKINIQLYD
jgi:hypothetical protein